MANLLLSETNIPPESFSVASFLKSITSPTKSTIPPTYIVHGDIDDKVTVTQSRDVVEALKGLKEKADIDYEYEELPGKNHLFDREPGYEMERMYQFIRRVFRS